MNVFNIDPKNLRTVTVPLQVDQIKEFFDNKELFFLLDYGQSKIKGNMFLTYISNMDLPSEIVLANATKEEIFELLKNYMATRNLNNSSVLKYTAAQIILEHKGIDSSKYFRNLILSKDECKTFISNNLDMVNKWNTFLNSTILYFVTSIKDLEESLQFKDSFQVIDDHQYVGSNVVQMFSVPFFMETFFSVAADTDLFYFKQQFEEYMFKGKSLFHYFDTPENTLQLVFNELISGNLDAEKLNSVLKENN